MAATPPLRSCPAPRVAAGAVHLAQAPRRGPTGSSSRVRAALERMVDTLEGEASFPLGGNSIGVAPQGPGPHNARDRPSIGTSIARAWPVIMIFFKINHDACRSIDGMSDDGIPAFDRSAAPAFVKCWHAGRCAAAPGSSERLASGIQCSESTLPPTRPQSGTAAVSSDSGSEHQEMAELPPIFDRGRARLEAVLE